MTYFDQLRMKKNQDSHWSCRKTTRRSLVKERIIKKKGLCHLTRFTNRVTYHNAALEYVNNKIILDFSEKYFFINLSTKSKTHYY